MDTRKLLLAWAIIATVGAVIATVQATGGSEGEAPKSESRTEIPETENPPDTRKAPAPDPTEIDALKARIGKLEQDLVAARDKATADAATIADLNKQLEPYLKQTRVTVQDVAAMLDGMKGKGLSALLEPAKTAKLVADLRALGDEGLNLLLGMMESETPADRMLAAKLLGDLADSRAVEALAKAAEDENDRVASMASQALALMGEPSAKDALRRLYDNAPESRPGIRINSLFGLCKLGESKAITQAQEFFTSTEVPEAYKRALGNGILLLDTPHVVPVVRSMSGLDKSSAELGTAVVRYLEKVRTDTGARTLLSDIVADTSYPQSVRNLAAQVLSM